MLWVGLFIAGVVGVLAGAIPMILNGLRGGNAATFALGALLLLAGTYGVVAKPDFLAFRLPRIVFGEQTQPPIDAAVVKSADSLPEPDAGQPAPRAAVPEADTAPKDESQLDPGSLPEPVAVTTTKIVGGESEPMATTAPAQEPMQEMPLDAPEQTASLAPEPPADDTAALAALAPQQKKDEAAFTKAVSEARAEYEQAGDDDRMALQSSRAAAICAAVKKPDVEGWVGRIKEIDKDAGGRTIVTVALPDGTLVKTWNNAMSDAEDKTLILAGTPLAAIFGQLAAGDTVRFSGTFFSDEPDCYRSSRLSLNQSMMEPSFLFRFSDVEKL